MDTKRKAWTVSELRQELVRFDRSHFSSYGDFALNFETVYWVETPVYLDFMNATQSINLKIKRRFEQEGIEFAYPTQTIFVAKPEGELSGSPS